MAGIGIAWFACARVEATTQTACRSYVLGARSRCWDGDHIGFVGIISSFAGQGTSARCPIGSLLGIYQPRKDRPAFRELIEATVLSVIYRGVDS